MNSLWFTVERCKKTVKRWPKWKRAVQIGSKKGKVRPV